MTVFLNLIDTEEERHRFRQLFHQYKDLLFSIAFEKTNSVEDAEDCVQETFFYVAKHFDKIGDIDSNSTKAYLAAIVTGWAIDVFHKYEKERAFYKDAESGASCDEDGADFEKYEAAELRDAMGRLDEEDRMFLYLKYIFGYKSAEIAEMYKVKASYIRKKLQLARQKLKAQLEERTE